MKLITRLLTSLLFTQFIFANIVYDMPVENHVDIMVYDLLGRDVESLYNGLAIEGTHTLTWDASHLSSGIYIVKFISGNTMQSQKVLLLK